MRMWMCNPKILCTKHLLGEHGEIHKHRHNFIKKHSISGRVYPVVQIQPASMKIRHDALAEEMIIRGYNHNSPFLMPDISYLPEVERNAKVDVDKSTLDLFKRCKECKIRSES